MKGIFTLFLVMLTASQGIAQKAASTVANVEGPLFLKETSHEFGKIPQGRPVTYNFEVKNKGRAPLVLNSVTATCGCTSPEWSSAPIAPGGSTFIKVGFNAAAEGLFSKTITINYNSEQVKTVVISGEVYPTPTTPAPLNSSLSILKQ